jgi:hypothetical protein
MAPNRISPAMSHCKAPRSHCRLCQLNRLAAETQRQLSQVAGRPGLKIAFGLAVPAIEAWLLCGVDSRVSEAAWVHGLKENKGRMPYSRGDLKRQLYETSHPSLAIETEAMTKAAGRLAQDFSVLERLFPHGFGALAASLRNW